jgi:hypothetical protein
MKFHEGGGEFWPAAIGAEPGQSFSSNPGATAGF